MERQIVLSSYLNKSSASNKTANFLTNFDRPIILDNNWKRGSIKQNNKHAIHLG